MNYTIHATSNTGGISNILPGQASLFNINGGTDIKTFSYFHSEDNSFTLSTHFASGYGEIFANPVPTASKHLEHHIPVRENYTWSSYDNDDPFSIDIKKEDPKYCHK